MSKLDLVFICDCTGSMGSYIHAAKTNIETIVTKIIQFEQADVRFALVEYRDHPPQDRTFAFRLTDFTTSLKNMKEAVNQMEADGGGDGPESVCCAFNCAVNLEWREEATKIIIWISDAPPHGFTKHGDGFPDGCPCKCDLIQEVRKCMDKDILIYSVGTEPLSYGYLRTLMRTVSELTNGQYVALSSAELLSDLIVNGCREEIQMKRIIDTVRFQFEQTEGFRLLSKEEKERRITEVVNRSVQNIKIDTVVIDSIFENELDPIPDLFLTCQSLKELKAHMYDTPDIKAIVKRVNNRYDDYDDYEESLGFYMKGEKVDPRKYSDTRRKKSKRKPLVKECECWVKERKEEDRNKFIPINDGPQQVKSERRELDEHQIRRIEERLMKYVSGK